MNQESRKTKLSPTPGIAIGRIIVFPNVPLGAMMSAFAAASMASPLSIHFRNRSRVAIIPFPWLYPSNCPRSRPISRLIHLT